MESEPPRKWKSLIDSDGSPVTSGDVLKFLDLHRPEERGAVQVGDVGVLRTFAALLLILLS